MKPKIGDRVKVLPTTTIARDYVNFIGIIDHEPAYSPSRFALRMVGSQGKYATQFNHLSHFYLYVEKDSLAVVQ